MSVKRVVPDFRTTDPEAVRDFYALVGLVEVMNHGWVMTLASRTNPSAQLTVTTGDASAPVDADVSIEVDDVDAVYAACVARGDHIVHPLTDEPWGVRRFFVEDPDGRVVNVLGHRARG
ncbi:VOC family protein [Yinghuangia sp. ASG 101]|uniref:VOC family protein n=1 Tax=Yinghuangia sp. ASG 101 TaxID=2896848 RepID=UPI001E42345D|nr:VOC family protein [Yinghuangia sp. ASG 101]UGQ14307.1 VOC family protein [Yinghuangia sp. ASG 101]